MKDKTLEAARQLIRDLKDPESEASKRFEQHLEEMTERARLSELNAQELYVKVCSYENFEDFMNWLSEIYDKKVEQAHKEGRYIDDIDEQWDLVRVAQTYGRELTEDEFRKVDNPFLGTAHYFKGYIFGIMNGQGSCPWYIKWDTSKFGPEQLSLF